MFPSERCSENPSPGERSAWIGGRYAPVVVLLVVYGFFNTVPPLWSWYVIRHSPAGPAPAWINGLVVAINASAISQLALFAAWVAFALGRWPVRLGLALTASACLAGLHQTQFWYLPRSWQEVLAPLA